MKKLFYILLLALLSQCTAPEQKDTDAKYAPDNDVQKKALAPPPGSPDGYCDIVFIGDGYGQQAAKFLGHAQQVKVNLLKREPFTADSAKLRFHYINSKQNLNCNTSGGLETALTCSWDKIKRELGTTPKDVVLILSWKNGYGGALGIYAAQGLNQLFDPYAGNTNYCSDVTGTYVGIEARAFDGTGIHEIGHAFGCGHDFNSANVMSYATNGGCFLVGKPFTFEHQKIIHDFIIKSIN